MNSSARSDTAAREYANRLSAFWDVQALVASRKDKLLHRAYQSFLKRMYGFMIPNDSRVLEIGCAEGDLLASLKPRLGVGVDFSQQMLQIARDRHPQLHYIHSDALLLTQEMAPGFLGDPFDFIILSDFVNESWDMLALLKQLRTFCSPHTRIVLNFHSHLYENLFQILQKSGFVNEHIQQNWFTPDDMTNLFQLAGFKVLDTRHEYLCPFPIPGIDTLSNRFLAKIFPFSIFNICHVQIARIVADPAPLPSVSVVIPARNEAGNIEAALQRTPDMGSRTEIIFVEGNSTDNTWDTIQEMAAKYSHRCITALRQPGKGKGDAVRCGFDAATGDILMILDADLTMPPETLPQFYEAIASGTAEFVNGVRLVYPQQKEAMRFCNLIANKFFSLTFSWLLDRSIKDTLCGTKVLSRENYQKIASNRSYFGEFDPFGDFDLLFGAAKQHLDIVDLPVRYRERTYGETNISRWRDGCILLKMVCFAAKRIKFV